MMDSMVYMGPSRFKRAWLMYLATYAYTRSFDGCEGPDGERMDFGIWYSFTCAVQNFWDYLRRPIDRAKP
jgi:hypothetical protein